MTNSYTLKCKYKVLGFILYDFLQKIFFWVQIIIYTHRKKNDKLLFFSVFFFNATDFHTMGFKRYLKARVCKNGCIFSFEGE